MEQNQPTTENQVLDQATNNDLQKAIDDITNNTNVDPVFSDPVAAPSSIPEGDTGELGEPVGPFPEPKLEIPTPAPEPLAPIDPVNLPDLGVPAPAPMPETMPAPAPEPAVVETVVSEVPTPAPAPTVEAPSIETIPQSLSTTEVKKAALRDLVPILNKVNMDQVQRFNIYRDIFNELRDYTVLEPAYQAAREIPDEKERAEALLYLVESIDKM